MVKYKVKLNESTPKVKQCIVQFNIYFIFTVWFLLVRIHKGVWFHGRPRWALQHLQWCPWKLQIFRTIWTSNEISHLIKALSCSSTESERNTLDSPHPKSSDNFSTHNTPASAWSCSTPCRTWRSTALSSRCCFKNPTAWHTNHPSFCARLTFSAEASYKKKGKRVGKLVFYPSVLGLLQWNHKR